VRGTGYSTNRVDCQVVTGVVFCLATPVGMLTVDRFGRRKLLLLGAAGQTACMALLATLFWAGGGETSPRR
jgi:MFS family permease